MDSKIETKVLRTEKQMAQSRRSFLQMGALGAVAVIAAGVIPGGKAHAAETATTKAVRSSGEIGAATGGKTTRGARKLGEMGQRAEGKSTRSTRSMQKQRSMKTEKSASGNRSMSTRKMGTQRSMKAMKATKS